MKSIATLIEQNNKRLLNTRNNILATLAYFDMWDYPLTYGEIFLFLENKYGQHDFTEALDQLVADKLVFHFDRFYSLKNDYMVSIKRNKMNKKAAELINKAKEVGAFLIKFPYVRGVGISGSLSKNCADENSDIDFFIITERNRLWLARTFMHMFKKLTFLVGKQHNYCMNYYIDEARLQIVEKNIYTAIEVATIIPLEGDITFENFYKANSWMHDFLPNKCMRLATAKPLKKTWYKVFAEKMLDNSFGSWLDNLLMEITAGRWNKKTEMKKLNMRGAVMSMAASKHFAKPAPENFQVKLIERYRTKVCMLLQQSEERVAQ
ncbi:nucleotidyltransferase domain-containing protein [Mucilaginibacter endophyticus]|uniref:nucleotidyltransferase domain-containing protein n=1 Tax=Mucilaginibacter endophyticus TaxID=2675003 RepID=UPI000E0D21A6|nr:nucleotidyltransferase domain-containing protein [Mucilaginibacter endophyticus]